MDTKSKTTSNEEVLVDSEYKSLMFYNTTIRNVGLYTSVSIALLGYASNLKAPSMRLTALFFLLSSLAFLVVAIMLNYNLYTTMKRIEGEAPAQKEELDPWVRICMMIFPIHFVILVMITGYVLFNIQNGVK